MPNTPERDVVKEARELRWSDDVPPRLTTMPTEQILSEEDLKEIEARLERLLSALTFGEPARGNRYVESVDGNYYFEENADNEFDAFDLLRQFPALCQTVRALRAENETLKNIAIPDSISDLVRRIDAAIRFSVPIQQQTKLRGFINELIFLNGSLHAEIVKRNDFRVRAIQLCRNKAADYQAARDSAYTSVPTCDAVSENEIRKAVADQLAAELENLDHKE